MEDDSRKALCDRCRKFVPLSDIKYSTYDKDKRLAICITCRTKLQERKEKETGKTAKKEFMCTRCRFKFKHAPSGASNLRCPYCGKDDKVVPYQTQSADALVRSSDDAEGFYSNVGL